MLAGLVTALAVLQFRWSSQLGLAARDRMSRDLRVATLSATSAVDLALERLVSALAGVADSSTVRRVLQSWESSHPQLAGLIAQIGWRDGAGWDWYSRPGRPAPLPPQAVRTGSGDSRLAIRFDSLFISRQLVPLLVRQIAQTAELEVTVALVLRDSSGAEREVAREGLNGNAQPDMAVALLATTGVPHFLFADSASVEGRKAPGMSWSEASSAPAGRGETSGWELRAWHGAGSLERAAAAIRHRNLALGLGLVMLVALVGGWSLLAFWTNQRLAEDRATILAGISHEVLTPLAVIRTAADNLRSGVVTGQAVPEYGALIDREVDRLSGTVTSALDFARGIAGAETRERVDLNDLAREAISLVEQPARVRFHPAEPAWCRGDRRALIIALRNLLANALEYSPRESPVFLLVGRSGREVRVMVQDTGPGLDPAELARIVEPFVRGRAGAESRPSGIGLGLALAERVARRHGGEITVVSGQGSGATFALSLPGVG